MKNITLLFCCFAGALAHGHAQNPIIQTIYTADPAPMVYKDTLFLYTGHDEDKATWFVMKDWHVYATTDMVNWVDRGSPLSLKTFAWAEKDAWAGHCIQRNGKFYWYVPVSAKGAGMSIGVAVADNPAGPFKDALGKPLITGGWGYIDPAVFIDDDGQAYIYWGNPHLYYVKLNKDMLSYDQATGIVQVPLTAESFKLRILDAQKTFAWAQSIDGLASHSVKSNDDNKYYWYVSAIDRSTGKKVIGVAVGPRANGPFTDVLGKPLITEHCDEAGNINPTIIMDDAKQSWLTWGHSTIWYAKLEKNRISYDPTAGITPIPDDKKVWFSSRIKGTVNSTEKRYTTYEEGPWLYKRNNLYYLFYPAGGVPEHLAYSTAATAEGPWTFRDTLMDVIAKKGAFTNHPGVVDYKGKTYLFYHNGALPGGGGFDRSVCVDELTFNADGSIPRILPTPGIEKAAGSVHPFARVEAETIAWEEGIETATDSTSGEVFVTSIHNGDYIKVRNVDFKKGARSFEAEVAPVNGGAMEIHADSLAGPLISTCEVGHTGDQKKWTRLSSRANKVKGMHDLYFVFKGGEGELFNVNWWRFNK